MAAAVVCELPPEMQGQVETQQYDEDRNGNILTFVNTLDATQAEESQQPASQTKGPEQEVLEEQSQKPEEDKEKDGEKADCQHRSWMLQRTLKKFLKVRKQSYHHRSWWFHLKKFLKVVTLHLFKLTSLKVSLTSKKLLLNANSAVSAAQCWTGWKEIPTSCGARVVIASPQPCGDTLPGLHKASLH